jgi:hypothetical protein
MTRSPGRPKKPWRSTLPDLPPAKFVVGTHEVRVGVAHERWTVALDGVLLPGWYATQADAWAAGVAEADRADAAQPLPVEPPG